MNKHFFCLNYLRSEKINATPCICMDPVLFGMRRFKQFSPDRSITIEAIDMLTYTLFRFSRTLPSRFNNFCSEMTFLDELMSHGRKHEADVFRDRNVPQYGTSRLAYP